MRAIPSDAQRLFSGERGAAAIALLGFAILAALAIVRPIDHDESQYVAAAVLAAGGALPYRDFAYLQTPLQPLLLAPLAAWAGSDAHLVLRLVNVVAGAMLLGAIAGAARVAGVRTPYAIGAAVAAGCCDILLFGVSVARNDALPAALLALAMLLTLRAERREAGPGAAFAIGLMLSAAAAIKISYALPAAAYGGYALLHRDHRPLWVAAGAAGPAILVAALWAAAPEAFRFGVLDFPALAPEQYYRADGRGWKLGMGIRLFDAVKFLALGPALLAIVVVLRRRRASPHPLLDLLIVAGVVAALLPAPTWRQYWLPVLPPLFVRAAMLVERHPPGRAMRIAWVFFAVAGLAPSLVAFTTGSALLEARSDGRMLARRLAEAGVEGPVASLSPQVAIAAGARIDPRFATGPFFFRSEGLVPPAGEEALHLVSRARLTAAFAEHPPAAILTGGENRATAGDPALDAVLDRWAMAAGWRRVDGGAKRYRLWVPQAAAARRASSSVW